MIVLSLYNAATKELMSTVASPAVPRVGEHIDRSIVWVVCQVVYHLAASTGALDEEVRRVSVWVRPVG